MIGFRLSPGRILQLEHTDTGRIVSVGGSRKISSAPSFNERMVRRCFIQLVGQPDFGLRVHWWWRMRRYARLERESIAASARLAAELQSRRIAEDIQ